MIWDKEFSIGEGSANFQGRLNKLDYGVGMYAPPKCEKDVEEAVWFNLERQFHFGQQWSNIAWLKEESLRNAKEIARIFGNTMVLSVVLREMRYLLGDYDIGGGSFAGMHLNVTCNARAR